MKKNPRTKTIVIVGLGLMGASLGMRLAACVKNTSILGLTRDKKKISAALRKKVITAGTTDPAEAFSSADVVFIATPVSAIPYYIQQVERYAAEPTIVTDLGSTKDRIVRWVDRQSFTKVMYVGSHPLAGSHHSGLDHANGELYKKALCFLTPTKNTVPAALMSIEKIWKRVGCTVIHLSPQEHDRLLAASSHYPHLLAYALVNATARQSKHALKFVGSGFKDTTRLAASLPELWRDIIITNREHIIRHNDAMIRELTAVQKILAGSNPNTLLSYLQKAHVIRTGL